jgi:hypothetical protein
MITQTYTYNPYMKHHVETAANRCNSTGVSLCGLKFAVLNDASRGAVVALMLPEGMVEDDGPVKAAMLQSVEIFGRIHKFELIIHVPRDLLK